MPVDGTDHQAQATAGATPDLAAVRLALPRISHRSSALHTRLARRWHAATIELSDATLTLNPCVPEPIPPDGEVICLEGTWDGQPAMLVLRRSLAARLEPLLGLVDLQDQELAALLVESVLQPLIERFERWTGIAIALGRVGDAASPPAELEAIGLRIAVDQGGGEIMVLHLPPTALDQLIERLEGLPSAPAAYDHLMTTVAFRTGATRLSIGEARSLRPHDVVMVEHVPDRQQPVVVIAGERWHYAGRFGKGGLLIATARRVLPPHEREIWAMNNDDRPLSAPTAAEDAELDDLPITMIFELGRQEIALGELRRLGPGATFGLRKEPSAAIDVYAGGRRIGQGEIVQIEDEVGVRLLRLFGHE